MIYYTRIDSKGRQLITGYKTASMAKTIAQKETKSTSPSFWDGEMYFDLKTGNFGRNASGVGLCSYIKGASKGEQHGRFAVFSKTEDGKPNDLGLRFVDYSSANTFIKAVVEAYGELWVVELDKVGEAEKPKLDIALSDEAPF